MDEQTSVAYLRSLVDRFCEERDWEQSPKDLSISMAVEAAELLEHFRFRTDKEIEELLQHPHERQAVAHEIADVLYHVLALASSIDFDLSAVFRDKMALSALRSPVPQPASRDLKAS
jgi:NTP pyrophosphatase (non-canonical NTP hydrolase)